MLSDALSHGRQAQASHHRHCNDHSTAGTLTPKSSAQWRAPLPRSSLDTGGDGARAAPCPPALWVRMLSHLRPTGSDADLHRALSYLPHNRLGRSCHLSLHLSPWLRESEPRASVPPLNKSMSTKQSTSWRSTAQLWQSNATWILLLYLDHSVAWGEGLEVHLSQPFLKCWSWLSKSTSSSSFLRNAPAKIFHCSSLAVSTPNDQNFISNL